MYLLFLLEWLLSMKELGIWADWNLPATPFFIHQICGRKVYCFWLHILREKYNAVHKNGNPVTVCFFLSSSFSIQQSSHVQRTHTYIPTLLLILPVMTCLSGNSLWSVFAALVTSLSGWMNVVTGTQMIISSLWPSTISIHGSCPTVAPSCLTDWSAIYPASPEQNWYLYWLCDPSLCDGVLMFKGMFPKHRQWWIVGFGGFFGGILSINHI